MCLNPNHDKRFNREFEKLQFLASFKRAFISVLRWKQTLQQCACL
jgi:hypothetical protein